MATFSSLGIGSGLDINSLVSQLVAAERAPRDKRLARDEARLTTEFSALAALKGAMAGLQGAANGLRAPDSFTTRKVSVGDEKYFSAAVTAEAVAGSYDVQVQQLATAARLGSAAHAGGPEATAGTGTLTIAIGAASFDITLAAGANSLAAVRDAINAAEDNPGVRATLIRDAAGTYLVLSGTATGVANAITVSSGGDADAGLQQLVADLNDFDATRDVAAQDAIAHVSGYEIRSASNAISGAIDGVTLDLKKATGPDETITLTVSRDDAAIQKKAEGFVAAYNALAQQVAMLGRYDAATQTAGPMLGDALLRGVDTQLRRILTDPVPGTTGSYRTLASIGIGMTVKGTLQLDVTKFQQALAADPEAVNRVFSSGSGVAVRAAQYLDDRLSATGEFAVRDERINTQRRRLSQEKDALEARMQIVQQRYMRQFTAMDGMLAQLQSTSDYLAQQLSSLAKSNPGG